MKRTFNIGQTEFEAELIDFTQYRQRRGHLECPKCEGKVKQQYKCDSDICDFKGSRKSCKYKSSKDEMIKKQHKDLIKAGIGTYKEIQTFAPISKERYSRNQYLIDNKTYLMKPKDNDTAALLREYLSTTNKILPIKYFRHRTNSLARSGYISAYQQYLILHVLKLPSELRELDLVKHKQASAVEIQKSDLDAFNSILTEKQVKYDKSDYYIEMDLIRKPASKKKQKQANSLLAQARKKKKKEKTKLKVKNG